MTGVDPGVRVRRDVHACLRVLHFAATLLQHDFGIDTAVCSLVQFPETASIRLEVPSSNLGAPMEKAPAQGAFPLQGFSVRQSLWKGFGKARRCSQGTTRPL